MRVVVATESRFDRTPDGRVWTQSMFTYQYWCQYLGVFDEVLVIARVRDVCEVASHWHRVDGQRVEIAAVPYYLGPQQYLLRSQQVTRAARGALKSGDAVILYFGQIASCIWPMLRRTAYPYGMYVVSDPQNVFDPGTIKHPLSRFFHWWFPRMLKRQCIHARAVAYVSKERLPDCYPVSPNTFTTHFAMQGLSDEWFVESPRFPKPASHGFTLIAVGSLAQLYKGPDTVIDALAICVQEGQDLRLVWVGEGKHRTELEARARSLGLEQRVSFRGQLSSGAAVRAELDQADLFVMPSRAEGLGLAFIEAMARGLPCIGSTVGGISEFLHPDDMVPPGDVQALARKICEMIADPKQMEHRSMRNLEKAREYTEENLRERRTLFYRYVCEQTEAWISASGSR